MTDTGFDNADDLHNLMIKTLEPEELYKKLDNNLRKIEMSYLDSKHYQDFKRKIEYYKIVPLISETKEIIKILIQKIETLEIKEGSPKHSKIDEYMSVLSVPGLNLGEILVLVKELLTIDNDLPKNAHVHENIQDDVVYGNFSAN